MTSSSLLRLAALGMAGGLSAGCGVPTPAPRRLDLPANIRPIGTDQQRDADREPAAVVLVQYAQPQMNRESRITSVNVAGDAPSAAIREPRQDAAEVAAPPAPARRSEFVPFTMPQAVQPPALSPAPPMAQQPLFTSIPAEGPQLITPIGPAAAAPILRPAPEPRPTVSQYRPAPAAPLVSVNASPGTASHTLASPQQSAAMQVVAQRAMQISDKASALADRGMLYSARTELIKALQLIAQALDAQEAGKRHSEALAAGLTALEEAREFGQSSTRPGESADVAIVAASHRTPLLDSFSAMSNSPIVAQQQYFAQAQQQLTVAGGGVPAASQVLYRLGRLQSAMAIHNADPLALHGPQTIVFHQAALATDGRNWLAANELGVLYARYGQLPEARQLLVRSVTTHPHIEGWHNLAVVHRRLGEADLAARAEHEWKLLADRTGTTSSDAAKMVRWVDTKTFAATGGSEVHWPATVAAKPATESSGTARR